MVCACWSIGSTTPSILSKMQASPLPFSVWYLNSHVNAALILGNKGAIVSSLVEADCLSWQPQAIPVGQPARDMCQRHSCCSGNHCHPLLKETKVHFSSCPGEKHGRDDAVWHKHSGHYPYWGCGMKQQAVVRH